MSAVLATAGASRPAADRMPHGMHADEWAARVQLAACYRVFDMLGWTEMIYNHITLRLPDSVSGGQRLFLINPFGLHYREVTASNLVKIDTEGRKIDDSPWPVNPAGFTVHSAIHQQVDGAHCVMHTHTTAGLAVACTQGGLAQNNFYSAQLRHGGLSTSKASPCIPTRRRACWPTWGASRC